MTIMRYLKYLISFFLVSFVFSCDIQDGGEPQRNLKTKEISELSSVFENDLNNIGDRLRKTSSDFSNKDKVSKIAKSYLIEKYDEKSYSQFKVFYEGIKSKSNSRQKKSLTDYQKSLIEEVDNMRSNSASSAAYTESLKTKFNPDYS